MCQLNFCKMNSTVNIAKNYFLDTVKVILNTTRFASKKAGGSTKNTRTKVRPKHRGLKIQDGHDVQKGHILVLQRTLRFHPGLNVGMGKNGTLFAMIPGRVVISCEKADVNWDHTWVIRCYDHRKGTDFFKKYMNVIPNPQHQNFKLIDQV